LPLLAIGAWSGQQLAVADHGSPDVRALSLVAASMAGLAFVSVVLLWRISGSGRSRISRDEMRIKELRRVSRSLESASTGVEAFGASAGAALRLSQADAVFVIRPDKETGKSQLVSSAGRFADALYADLADPLLDLHEIACAEKREVVIRGDGWGLDKEGAATTCVLPMQTGQGGSAALCTVQRSSRAGEDSTHLDSLSTLASLTSVGFQIAELRHQQRNFFAHMTELLVKALDAHLDYNDGHSHRVARYCHALARALGLEEARMERLFFASLLHDIGMLRIDRHEHDRRTCREHPRLGERMLRGILVWSDVANIVLHHHEWFDGSGYPNGIRGGEIPIESRIISVCDAFDAITSHSSYAETRPVAAALQEIEAGAGTQFDPEVGRCFVDMVRSGRITRLED
jgi:putative nucleotidyltransferase with HDIG domain